MPYFKTVYIFNSGRNGWTETWYQQKSTIDQCTIPAQDVAGPRQDLLGKFANIEAIRIVSEDKPRVHVLLATNFTAPVSGLTADTPWNAIQARVTSADRAYQRTVICRAPVDDYIDRNGNTGLFNSPATNPFGAKFATFVQMLKDRQFSFKARSKTGEGGTFRPAVNFAKEAGTNRLQVTVAGNTQQTGEKVSFSGVTGPGSSLANGTHTIRSNIGGLLILEDIVPAGTDPTQWSNGQARANVTTYPVVDTGVALRPMKRSTGRAFFVTRGRR